MAGTLLNTFTVLFGSTIGLILGNRLPSRVQESVVIGLALVTIVVGIDNAAKTGNVIIVLLSVLIGVIIGELLRIDRALERFADGLQRRFAGGSEQDQPITADNDGANTLSPRERFITGFVTASLVFCVGPLTVLGSIQDGMGLDIGFQQLAIKSTLDAFASMAFAATFGIGVMFTALTVLVFQGSLALIGAAAGQFMTTPMIDEMTATGGVILIGLALVILEVRSIRIANFLPALLVAPLIVFGGDRLNVDLYPFDDDPEAAIALGWSSLFSEEDSRGRPVVEQAPRLESCHRFIPPVLVDSPTMSYGALSGPTNDTCDALVVVEITDRGEVIDRLAVLSGEECQPHRADA